LCEDENVIVGGSAYMTGSVSGMGIGAVQRTVVLLVAVLALALAAASAAHASRRGKNYFPGVEVVTQHGKSIPFHEGLLKDKIFLISFMYTSCREICPLSTARLSELQDKLGDSMGREIFFYSISVDPETDTPERLKEYADTFGAGPGWLFLTGKPHDIYTIRDKLGDRGKSLSEHRTEVLLGNGHTNEWARNTMFGDLNALAIAVRQMDSNWRLKPSKKAKAVIVDLESRPGEAMFTRMCNGCHTVGKGSKVGPDLAGVTARRDRDWLLEFISEPEKMRRQNDPVALELMAGFPTVRMPPMGISKTDAVDLLAYINYIEDRDAARARPLESLIGLTTHVGAKLSPEAVTGQPAAVFFGFTHCPDVCPTTLLDWSNVLEGLGKDSDRLKVLFVSVDAERDTPQTLAAYMDSFDKRITALTGSKEEIAHAARTFDAFYEKVPGTGGGYSFDHTTKVYLIGRDGKVAGAADLRTPEADRRKMLSDLLSQP
jgi:protein SCO1